MSQALLSAFDRRGLLRKSGAAGAGVILLGSLIAALFYRGRLGEAYNPLNHFVSELGEVGISAAAWAFNGGLLIGGVLLVVFLVGLGRRIGGWLGGLFGAVGLACGICGTAVGAVPMNDLLPHIFWARSFFNLGLGTMLFFSVIALLNRPGLPRRLAIPGAVATLAFAAFLAIPQPTASAGGDILGAVMAMLNSPRPAVWAPAVLEWLAVLSVLGWALSVALALREPPSGAKTNVKISGAASPVPPGDIAPKNGIHLKDRIIARARPILEFLGKVLAEFSGDGAPRMAAAIAYYTIFSLAPLLVIVVAVIGLIVGQQNAQTQLVGQLAAQVGQESAELVASLVARAFNPASSIIALLIGALGVLGGASTVVLELRAALNKIWDVNLPPTKGIKGFLLSIVKPWLLVLTVGAVIVASTALSTVLTRASGELMRIAPALSIVGGVADVLISLLVTTLAFAMALKILPLVKLEWRDVWVGAFVTAVLFGIGKYALTWYLGTSGVGSPYGAAGSLVLLLVWVFYSAQIFLLGAEFTQVFARTRGTRRREGALLDDPDAQSPVVSTEKRKMRR